MAHFAQLDENNKVIRVIVVGNEFTTNDAGIEIEQLGIDFCKKLTGNDTTWIQTSYNHNFRKNFAGPGHTYDPVLDAFIPEKMHESWVLNDRCSWIPPIPYPTDGKDYYWDETVISWIENTHKGI